MSQCHQALTSCKRISFIVIVHTTPDLMTSGILDHSVRMP
jgi:hypothetical protein